MDLLPVLEGPREQWDERHPQYLLLLMVISPAAWGACYPGVRARQERSESNDLTFSEAGTVDMILLGFFYFLAFSAANAAYPALPRLVRCSFTSVALGTVALWFTIPVLVWLR